LRKIATITPYFLEGFLILGISQEWSSRFEGIPKFEVSIDNKNRMHFISKESVKLPS